MMSNSLEANIAWSTRMLTFLIPMLHGFMFRACSHVVYLVSG